MAYETKVILALVANQVGKSKTIKEAYDVVVNAANIEGLKLPKYEDFLKEQGEYNNKD
ncbi:MAG: hypothetical protein FWF50_02420 [Defluviitaleaceae bacterium]|nr:hypothetical protein [Defluviitaleaceae bacterium]